MDHENSVWMNDYGDIEDWIKKNSSMVSVLDSAKGHYVLIDINPSLIDEVTYDLSSSGIIIISTLGKEILCG